MCTLTASYIAFFAQELQAAIAEQQVYIQELHAAQAEQSGATSEQQASDAARAQQAVQQVS